MFSVFRPSSSRGLIFARSGGAGEWKRDDRPPYGVRSTSTLSPDDIRAIEEFMHRKSPLDCMTEKFVGTNLPDLFSERITLDLSKEQRLR